MTTTRNGPLIYRQSVWTRLTHWIWAICLFFLMLTGLQIFNAYPKLQFGDQSGFEFDNAFLEIGARRSEVGLTGYTDFFGYEFDTTGILGVQGDTVQGVPGALTIPSTRDLATGRLIHFFFAWLLVGTLAVWLIASALNGHLRALAIRSRDIRALPSDIAAHARLRFHHSRDYNVLQKLSYAGVLFVLLPLMILTGLSMSPTFNATAPWMLDIFGGRQSARSIHFLTMLLLVGFFIIHMLMLVAAGPLNELRSILTGWYRVDADQKETDHV